MKRRLLLSSRAVCASSTTRVLDAFHKQTRVIVTSVYPLAEQRRLIAGALDYYDKSQGIEVLLSKIRRALESPA